MDLRPLLLGFPALLCFCSFQSADVAADAEPLPDAAYEVVEGWPALPDDFALFGEAVGVGVDSHGHVFVFHRADRDFNNTEIIPAPTIAVIDGSTGELLATFGANQFVVPHGLSIDRDDNLWVTDVALNKVFKLSHDGDLLLAIGSE